MGDNNQTPRLPKDMPGLLKFCIEATKGEDAMPSDPESTLASMDPERRRWLEQALSSMSVDVIKELTECIKILKSSSVKKAEASPEDIGKVEYAFDCIGDWVDNLDMANNFHKIGGFEGLKYCLQSPHASLRSGSANSIAELSQNNPYCQEKFVDENFLERLLNMITNDKDVQVKLMYAISCMIRDCPKAQDQFLNLNGPEIIMNACMTTSNDKLKIKACFFVSSVSEENAAVKAAFVDIGTARQILTLMQMEEHDLSHEHMVRALLTILRDNEGVKQELVTSKELNFHDFLLNRLQLIEGKEEYDEEREYLKEIVQQCYKSLGSSNNDVDR